MHAPMTTTRPATAAIKSFIRDRLPPGVMMRHIVAYDLKNGEPELLLLPLVCDKSAAMIDVGGHLGVYSYVGAKYSAHVHTFEPNPDSASWIRRVAPPNVTVHQCAVSDRESRCTLYIPSLAGVRTDARASLLPEVNPGAALTPVEVDARPIDAMGFGRVAFLKIDVEGHEQAVLRGAAELIARERPTVQIESEERHVPNAVRDTAEFFAGFGYRGYFWKAGALRPIDTFDRRRDQNVDNLHDLAHWHDRIYINNFLFVHPARAETMARLPLARAEAA